MALTTTQQSFATALARDLPGLQLSVAQAWAAAEVGDVRKSLGTGGASGPAYATPELGAQAAADLIKSSPLYAGIRASLSSTNPNTQATAIAQSPWHLGGEGLKRAGGTDPYYKRVFGTYGLTVGNTISTISRGTQGPSTSGTPLGTPLGAWGNAYSLPEGTIIQESDVQNMLSTLDKQHAFDIGGLQSGVARSVTETTLRTFIGKPWNKTTQDAMQSSLFSNANQATALPKEVAKNATDILGFAVGHVLLIIGGILCIAIGVWIVIHGQGTQTDPALLRVLSGGKEATAVA